MTKASDKANQNFQIEPFEFHTHNVRVVVFEDGRQEWIAKDVCDALEITDSSHALDGLEDDERGRITDPSGDIPRTYGTVNEPGLYSLILRSRKPQARDFKRWVTHEVLPAIRKHGYYVAPGNEAKALAEIQAQLLTMGESQQAMTEEIARTRALHEGSRTIVAQLTTRIDALSKKYDNFDDDHPNGLFGKKESAELRSLICQTRDLLLQMGNTIKPLILFNKLDNRVRTFVGYVRSSGASWEFATISMGREAKSFAARELQAVRKELRAAQTKDKRKSRASQMGLNFDGSPAPGKNKRIHRVK